MLAKKYGVSTKAVEIDRVPEEYGVMDAAGIRENLGRIHDLSLIHISHSFAA